jgi:hypothetical protein
MRKPVSWKRNNYLNGSKGGISPGPTKGLSSPKNNRQGCLCLGSNNYSRNCCDGLLINQGIGQTISPSVTLGSFSTAFAASEFDVFS